MEARKITIEIVGDGNSTSSTSSTSTGSEQGASVTKTATAISSPDGADNNVNMFSSSSTAGTKVAVAGALLAIGQTAMNLIVNVASIEYNRYTALNEDYITQNKVAVAKQAVNTQLDLCKSAASGMQSGAAIGSALGPVGAIVGGLVGMVAGTALTTNAKLMAKEAKQESYNMQLNAVNIQTSFASRRASLINGGRGTEN